MRGLGLQFILEWLTCPWVGSLAPSRKRGEEEKDVELSEAIPRLSLFTPKLILGAQSLWVLPFEAFLHMETFN